MDKKSNIYIGVIKECRDVTLYNSKQEICYKIDFRIHPRNNNVTRSNTRVVNNNAILIKTKYGYIELGKECLLKNRPTENEKLYVEENTLMPYYDNNLKECSYIKRYTR